jgi:acetyl-CoA C-acetyltransferase
MKPKAKASIIGVGMTKFGSVLETPEIKDKTFQELAAEATFEALDDAGIEPKDIDAFFVGHYMVHTSHVYSAFRIADWIGMEFKPTFHFATGCSTTNTGAGIAFMSIASGVFDTVLVVGCEILSSEPTANPSVRKAVDSDTFYNWLEYGNDQEYFYSHCYDISSLYDAFPIIGYAKKYKVPIDDIEDALLGIAVCARRAGARNPKAYFQKELEEIARERGFSSVEDFWRSKYNPYVTFPVRLYNIVSNADGASAYVVTRADKAEKYNELPIDILGFGWSCDSMPWIYEDPTYWPSDIIAAKQAFKMARVKPEEVEYLAVGDCSPSEYFIVPEEVGYFKKGECWKAYRDRQISFDGDKPINTNGGHLSTGNPAAATPGADLYEIVKQMRGQAEGRQIKPEPRIALWHSCGIGNQTAFTILRRRT